MKVGEWLAFGDMGAYTLVAGGTFNGFPLPKLHTVSSPDAWYLIHENFSLMKNLNLSKLNTIFTISFSRNILKDFMSAQAFVVDDVPVFLKAGVGYNRDAVGWGYADSVELAVDGGIVTPYSSDEAEDGHSTLASSLPSDDDSAANENE